MQGHFVGREDFAAGIVLAVGIQRAVFMEDIERVDGGEKAVDDIAAAENLKIVTGILGRFRMQVAGPLDLAGG